MTKNERILLRDELFNKLKSINVINKTNQFLRSKLKKIDDSLYDKLILYFNEFRTKEEAIYCILNHDDFENHKCFNCEEICKFDNNSRQKIKYSNTCEKIACINKYKCKININEFIQFIKDQYKLKGSKLTIAEILKVYKLGYSTINHYIKQYNLLDYVQIKLHKDIKHYDVWNNDEKFIDFIKNEYEKRGLLSLSLLKETFTNTDSVIKNKLIKLNLLKYFYIRENDHKHIKHYDIWNNDEKFIDFIKEQYKLKGILKTSELEDYFSVCNASIRNRVRQLNLLKYVCIRKFTQRNINNYPDIWSNDKKFIDFIKEQFNIKGSALTISEIRKYLSVNADSLRNKIKKLNLLEYFYIKPTSKEHIEHYNIWSNNEKFIQFIKNKYAEKEMFLVMTEIASYFNVCPHRVRLKITKLNLLNYFYIQQSNLEVDFESFLKSNNINFKKYDKSILNHNKEIDFLCDNIGFEINDIATHNSQNIKSIAYKYPNYHYEKTISAQEKNVKLIHIWEWEIRDNYKWNKLSKWILNELNNNKINIDLSQCNMCYINQLKAKEFFDLYDINTFKEYNYYVGIFYQNNLICTLLINKNGKMHMILKYNYILNDNQKLLFNFCKQLNININYLMSDCDLSKDNGDNLKRLGFKLINLIEPNIIWCNSKLEIFDNQQPNCIPIYNCGYAIFELKE